MLVDVVEVLVGEPKVNNFMKGNEVSLNEVRIIMTLASDLGTIKEANLEGIFKELGEEEAGSVVRN